MAKLSLKLKIQFRFNDQSKSYVIPKKSIRRIGLIFQDEICLMNGCLLVGRPEDRLLK